MINSLDEAIKHCEEVAIDNESMCEYNLGCSDSQYQEWRKCAKEHRQLAEWLRELGRHRKQIQNLIDNESFEIVNPFNTYEYARVVRVADLYDLMEVNADGDR